MKSLQALAVRGGIVGSVASSLFIGAVLLAGGASAQTADPVLDGFDGAQTKALLYGGAMVTLTLATVALWVGIKYIHKIRSNA